LKKDVGRQLTPDGKTLDVLPLRATRLCDHINIPEIAFEK
jgi:hypothetical protein